MRGVHPVRDRLRLVGQVVRPRLAGAVIIKTRPVARRAEAPLLPPTRPVRLFQPIQVVSPYLNDCFFSLSPGSSFGEG
jgi:hypothetical protein